MYSISRLREIIFAKNSIDRKAEDDYLGSADLHQISISLGALALLFLALDSGSDGVFFWLFLSLPACYFLVSLLVRIEYDVSSRLLLLLTVNITVFLLAIGFHDEIVIQTLFIPAGALSILLFGNKLKRSRIGGIMLAAAGFMGVNFTSFDEPLLTADESSMIGWSVLAAGGITWMMIYKFTTINERTGQQARRLEAEIKLKEKELAEKRTAVRKAEQEVQNAAEGKIDFLSSLSHEVRTPLNAIIGMTNLLVRENPRDDQLDRLEILDFSSKTLLALINDMLDFSKVESGNVEFEQIPFNVKNLLSSVLDNYRFTAGKKSIDLFMKLTDDVPEMIVGDPNRLSQILNNLVSNAVKFTDAGSAGIMVKRMEGKDSKVHLLFCVKDSGKGLTKETQVNMLDQAMKYKSDSDMNIGGAGLGLSISKKLIELQGGSLYVQSEIKEGSTFFVELPFMPDEEPVDHSNEQRPAVSNTLDGTTVLVVEDNMINQKVLTSFLKKWRVRTIIAENGEKALSKLQNNEVHLVLMDLQMPIVDGYEATQLIRSLNDRQKAQIPIIALTASVLKEVKEKVFATGMDDYLSKPFNPDELQTKLKHYICNGGSVNRPA